MPVPVLVDTDLGTDPDDLLALLALAADSGLELVGVTTCYGDTTLRADLVAGVLAALGLDVPVGAGRTEPLSGAEVWLAGNEHHHAPPISAGPYPTAVDVIREAAGNHPGMVVAAIGPLTNVADALAADPTLANRLAGLAIMGGDFADPTATEHNFRSDDVATRQVLASGVPLTVLGIEQTRRVRITRGQQGSWETGTGLARRLRADGEWWMSLHDEDYLLAHDPLTLLMISNPELFSFTGARLDLSEDTSLRWTADPGSNVRIVTELAVDALRDKVIGLVRDALR